METADIELQSALQEMERLAAELEVSEIERDLRKFIPLAWPVIEPHRPFVPNWHIDAIADHLMGCTEGHIRNLIINIPPRHMKSQTVSVFWPAWEWIRYPHIKGLFVSYARNLVIRDAVKTRRIITSDWYQRHWGHVFKLSSDQNVKSHFENDQGGVRLVGSMDAGVTGEGGDRLCVDDPLKLEDADNKAQLEHVSSFWDSVLSSRLNDPMTGIRVIIMQRLNARDLTGHVLSKEKDWVHLFLPTEFEAARVCRTFYHRNDYKLVETTDPATGETKIEEKVEVREVHFEDPRTIEGELLNPLRFGPKEVEQSKIRNGPWHYAGQQQQRPVPQGGGMFQRKWWRFYINPPDQLEMQGNACQAWDMSFKKTDDSSYVAGHVGAMVGPNLYMLYERRDRMDFPTALDAVRATKFLFPWVGPILVEDKANGTAVISVLQKEIPGIIARPNNDGTYAMANATAYMVQSGNVYLPGKYDSNQNLIPAHPWVEEFITELESYPKGEYSDRVSSFAHMLMWFHERMAMNQDTEDILSVGNNAPPAQEAAGWIF